MARASQVARTRRPASRSCWAPGCCSSISARRTARGSSAPPLPPAAPLPPPHPRRRRSSTPRPAPFVGKPSSHAPPQSRPRDPADPGELSRAHTSPSVTAFLVWPVPRRSLRLGGRRAARSGRRDAARPSPRGGPVGARGRGAAREDGGRRRGALRRPGGRCRLHRGRLRALPPLRRLRRWRC
jgi:hypothetical protein